MVSYRQILECLPWNQYTLSIPLEEISLPCVLRVIPNPHTIEEVKEKIPLLLQPTYNICTLYTSILQILQASSSSLFVNVSWTQI